MLLEGGDRTRLEEEPAVVGVGRFDVDRRPERTLDLERQPDQLVTDVVGESEFKVFTDTIASGGVVRAINARGAAASFSNTALKPGGELATVAETYKARGLAWMM